MGIGQKRNYLILLYDSVVYAMALALFDTNTVIPYFLREIGVSQMMPWVDTIKQVSYFAPQVILFHHVTRASDPVRLITKIMFLDRPQLFLLPLLIVLGWSGKLLGAMFFISIFVFYLGEGAILLYWLDVLARSTSARERGYFFGYSQIFGGIGAAALAFYVQKLLNSSAGVYASYEKIFLLAACLVIPSLFLFPLIRLSARQKERVESIDASINASSETAENLRESEGLGLKKPEFMRLLLIQGLIGLGGLALPYYLFDLLDHFPNLEHQAGTLAMGSMSGVLLGGILWGGLSAWRGNKKTIQATIIANLAVPLLFLYFLRFSPEQVPIFSLFAGFMLTGAIMGGWLGFVNYIMETSSEETRPRNLLIYNVTMVLASFYPLLGGYLRGLMGHEGVLVLISVMAFVAFILAMFLKEPRDELRPGE